MTDLLQRLVWYCFGLLMELKEGDLVIDCTSFVDFGFRATYKGILFTLTIFPDQSIVFKAEQESMELVNAISNVSGYSPFCRYTYKGLSVYEWGKNPQPSLKELMQDSDVTNLVTFVEY